MVFQYGTTASSGAYRDVVTKLVAFATSQHVSAAVINAAGTGYVVGDILTISHAGGYLPCLIEVLTVGGSGEVLTFRIHAGGAFSNRVASVVVNAGGSGYVTNDVVRLTTGTFTEFAKLQITASAGAAVSATVFETGGAYTVAPDATASATNSDIGTGSGTGATFDVTMTGLIGTTGAATTGGTGSGATFDLTLTASGWSAVWNRNDYSFNSITNEKEVILRGTVAGGDPPYVGLRSYTATSGDVRYGVLVSGMDTFNGSLTFDTMPNTSGTVPSSNTAPCLLLFNNAQDYWFNVTARRLLVVVKTVGASITSYVHMHAGLMNPFGTQTESPYPMFIAATSRVHNRKPDAGGYFVTGLTEMFSDSTTGPAIFRRQSDGAWTNTVNVINSGSTNTSAGVGIVYPLGIVPTAVGASANEDNINGQGQLSFSLGSGTGISAPSGSATVAFMPTIGDGDLILMPTGVLTHNGVNDNTSETLLRGELDGVYWFAGVKSDGTSVASEDEIEVAGVRHIIFANVHRSELFSYLAIRAA